MRMRDAFRREIMLTTSLFFSITANNCWGDTCLHFATAKGVGGGAGGVVRVGAGLATITGQLNVAALAGPPAAQMNANSEHDCQKNAHSLPGRIALGATLHAWL